MAGYSDEANEIYLEVKADIFMQSLRTPSQSAKFVRIKLTGKAGPCLSVEAELVNFEGIFFVNLSQAWNNTFLSVCFFSLAISSSELSKDIIWRPGHDRASILVVRMHPRGGCVL